VDGHDGVLVVVGTGELELQLQRGELARQAVEEALDLGVALALRQELAPGGQLVGVGAQALQGFEAALQAAPLLQDGGALRAVVPEAGVFQLVVDLGQAPLQAGVLKDTPGGSRAGL